jgi:hypothetical protein
MNQEVLDQVAVILRHPFRGLRKTDPQLAQAALTGHLGLRRSRPAAEAAIREHGSLADGLRELKVPVRPKGVSRLRSLLRILQRRWYLRRNLQVDQGQTPWCVDATRCHWQLSLPLYGRLTHLLGDLYEECKKIDPWPGEDGTSATYMLQVCERLGLVESSWWYSGPADAEATLRWLTEVGGLWFGAMWPESAFRTDDYGLVTAVGPWQYGHEVFLIGRTRSFRRLGPAIEGVQSWGQDNYGIRGRFWIREQDFFDHWMHPDQGWGDLVGVVEKAAA